MNPRRFTVLCFVILLAALSAGCIRLFGKAGYYRETPEETTEKTVGFDTQELYDSYQRKGSVTAS